VTIEFRILGPLEVAVDGVEVPLPARQQRVLLSALLIDVGQVVSTDRLIDALWGESPPPTAKAALHNVVAELRRLLSPGGEPLSTRPPGYLVSVEAGRFDLREFESKLEQGRSALAEGESRRRLSTRATRSPCGAGSRWRTSRTSRSRRPRSRGSTRCGWWRSSRESRPISRWDTRPS
jgi:DNA-binding SARP family transcriptional activator